MNHSFRTFIDLPVVEQKALQEADYSGMKIWSSDYLNGTTDYNETRPFIEDITVAQIRREKQARMSELEQKLKSHDYYYVFSNGKSYTKGKESEEEIEDMVAKIDGMDGKKDALKLYRKYLKKNENVGEAKQDKVDLNITMSGSGASLKKFLEDKKEPILTDYEIHLRKKMKEWGIKSTSELFGEPKTRFWNEVDNEYKCKHKSVEEMVKDITMKHQ